MTSLLVILMLFAVAGYWWHAMRIREAAKVSAERACRQANVQLLDDTVALHRFELVRNPGGGWQLLRCYQFEFATDGRHRFNGQITMAGNRSLIVEMDPFIP